VLPGSLRSACKAIRSARVFREKGVWSSVRSSLGLVPVLALCADRGLWFAGGNAGGVGGEGLLKLLHDGGRSVKYRRSTSEPAATFEGAPVMVRRRSTSERLARVAVSPLTATDDARSPARGGEKAAGGTEVQTSMQHPLMSVHEGGALDEAKADAEWLEAWRILAEAYDVALTSLSPCHPRRDDLAAIARDVRLAAQLPASRRLRFA
jgi:hypothetical protein